MLIAWLGDIRKQDIESAGGKGANLGELHHGALPVPPGFVVTTAAYNNFFSANRLQERIAAWTADQAADDPATLETIATQIHALFLAGDMPQDLSDALRAAYGELAARGGDAVAVRSSATAEDLPDLSFAGQQETYLNVRGAERLVDAVRRCWASLWTARAMAYRLRHEVDPSTLSMAVVIQAMVPAQVSGILFTANPASGARNELVINAGFGLGEAIVSGAVSPDAYVVDRKSLTPKESRLGEKAVMVVPALPGTDGENTQQVPVPEGQRREWALSQAQIRALAELGLRVEALFGKVPQDIEWAVADGRIWLLQARPITNLPPAPVQDVRWEPPRPNSVWMRRQVVEHMPDPLSPLFAELYLQGLDRSLDAMVEFMSELAGVEINLWEFFRPPLAATVNGYAYSSASIDFRWRLVPVIAQLYVRVLPKILRDMLPYWQDEALPTYQAAIARWQAVDLDRASDADLLRGVGELAVADAVYWFAASVPLGLARMSDTALDRFLKWTATERRQANGLRPTAGPYLRGFPSKTLDAQAELEAVACRIRRSHDLRERVNATPASRLLAELAEHPDGPPVLEELQGYLDRYGHQIYSLDFAEPTQADDPLPVLLSLKAAVSHGERDTRGLQAALAREREALVTRTEGALNPLQRRMFRLLLGWAQRYVPYREEALFYVGAAWPALRRLALELGRRLTEAGSLAEPEDVFFLHSAELAGGSAARAEGGGRPRLAALAQERRALREARKRLDPPLVVPLGARFKVGPFDLAMLEPQPRPDHAASALRGYAVSPGRVTATASVIRSPREFAQMQPDTILVCSTTTPAWTPLFSHATGLVTDIGGALAHGSIVAREYGIPAVMGTGVATQRIHSGQRVTVDGDRGTVTLPDAADSGAENQSVEPERSAQASRKSLLALAVALAALLFWWRRRRRRRHKGRPGST